MSEFEKPTIVSIKQYDTTVEVRNERSDLDIEQFVRLVVSCCKGVGYNNKSLFEHLERIAKEEQHYG